MNGLYRRWWHWWRTAAIALARAGHRVVLVEKLERFSPWAQVSSWRPMPRILAALGVDLSSRGYALPFPNILRADGTVPQQLNAQRLSVKYGPTWAIDSPSAHDALLGALPSEVEVILGRTVLAVKEVGDAVEVQLEAEPNVRRFDFVVGADGFALEGARATAGAAAAALQRRHLLAQGGEESGFTGAIEAWGWCTHRGSAAARGAGVLLSGKDRTSASATAHIPRGLQDTFGNFEAERKSSSRSQERRRCTMTWRSSNPRMGRSQVFLLGMPRMR